MSLFHVMHRQTGHTCQMGARQILSINILTIIHKYTCALESKLWYLS